MSLLELSPNHRILVIDDNPSIHEDFRKILCPLNLTNAGLEADEASVFGESVLDNQQTQFVIDSAFQGKDGLAMVKEALLKNQPYAMAFVDVRMPPGWDGVETIMHLWKEYPQLQVVICTAYSDYSWDEMIKKLGQSDSLVILKKPFDNIEVLQLAHALTKKWLLAQQERIKLEDLDEIVKRRTQELADANEKLVQEIQARSMTAAALRLSEERFEKAFRANPLAMAIQTLHEGKYVDVNVSYLNLAGLNRNDIVGHTPQELAVDFMTHTWALVRQQWAEKKSVRSLTAHIQDPRGAYRDIVLWGELFQMGTEPLMLIIAQDVSERVQLENQLRQSKKTEAIGQLAAGVAHDFNNILTVIQGHANLQLSFRNLNTEVKDSFLEISNASERAARLTRQLLAYGRKQSMQRIPVDLNQLIIQLGQLLRRAMGENIKVICELSGNLPMVLGDPGHLEQVLLNLVLNAKDAMPNGGSLTLRTATFETDEVYLAHHSEATLGSFVALSVKDTGTGIATDSFERIFEPFFTTKDVGKGSGMGLAMVYGIMKQHGGWIEVASQVNHGSAFTLFLPVTFSEEVKLDAPEAEVVPAAISSRGTERILVVEDEPAVKKLIGIILESAGYSVVVAGDGAEALEFWKREQGNFQLLLTDNVMPNGVSGNQLAQTLLLENPRLKVVITTGYSSTAQGKGPGMHEQFKILAKPYSPEDLLQVIRARLDS